MTTPKHSPLPWYLANGTDIWDYDPFAPDCNRARRISMITLPESLLEEREANAELIVKAVNHYRNLISIAFRVGNAKCSCAAPRCIHKEAKAAWKKAEGIDE